MRRAASAGRTEGVLAQDVEKHRGGAMANPPEHPVPGIDVVADVDLGCSRGVRHDAKDVTHLVGLARCG